MKILKYWYITQYKENFMVAHGIVFGHKRLPDGEKIHTSYIKKVEIHDGMADIETKNSLYHCQLNEALFECFDNNGKSLLPDFGLLKKKYERELELPGTGDGALILLDAAAEYYFVGAVFQMEGQRKEFRTAPVHLGMFLDSIVIEWYDWKSKRHVSYCYFPTLGCVLFYRWSSMKTYIQNAGATPIEVTIAGQSYHIGAGEQTAIEPIWNAEE